MPAVRSQDPAFPLCAHVTRGMATQKFLPTARAGLAPVSQPSPPSPVALFQLPGIAAQSGSTAGTFCEVGRGSAQSVQLVRFGHCGLDFGVAPPPDF